MVSTFAAALFAALGLTGPAAAPATTPLGGAFFVSGHGWGHGVGLAQYGAYGYALHGWTSDQIVAHYYPGTELGAAPVKRVRVLLVPGAKRAAISSTAPFSVVDGSGKSYKLAAGKQQLGPGLKLKLATGTKALPGPLVFAPGTAPLQVGSHAYRGSLRVTGGTKVRVVNVVGLEPYLWGVVPREMPDRWPAEALKAQAVVARTYALSHLERGGDFDLYPDTRSQVYGGVAAESQPATDAVQATAGQVVLYQGAPAETFFSSSSGGRTANVQDVWTGSKPMPYLISVPDPYDTLSPYHDWGPLRFGAAQLGRRLGARGTLLDVRPSTGPDGRVLSLTLVGTKGTKTITGSSARAAMGLRSTWFTIGALTLTPPTGPLEYGTSMHMSGIARGLPRVTLQSRPYGGQWKPLAVLTSRHGQVTATLSPKVTTDYRISSGIVTSSPVRVSVMPSVRITAAADHTSVSGVVKPLLPGASVQLQRQAPNGTWLTVAQATLASDGSFQASANLVPGTYRARCAPGKGFAAGLSPELMVVAA
ncbi:MAG TPA: SpoIID/LytB domain-containing protein [Gaiellaceae bacterium]|nr:SpoIID/LytB domain-containing protein [Gaiellaceae bacterium]